MHCARNEINIELIYIAAPTCPLGPTKVEEKKTTPVKNGSKPEAASPPAHVTKISPHKSEEQPQTRTPTETVQQPKAKPIVQVSSQSTVPSAKPSAECPTPGTPPKAEQKITSTPRTVKRKSRELKDLKGGSGEGGSKPKRHRVQTQPYQSPLPEIALIVKTLNKTPAPKNPDDKLIVFYKYVDETIYLITISKLISMFIYFLFNDKREKLFYSILDDKS